MEKWCVIGYRKVDFKDSSTNKSISGYSLFVTRPGGDSMVGDEAQKIFVSDQRISYVPVVGDEIQLVYNKYGKVSDVVVC